MNRSTLAVAGVLLVLGMVATVYFRKPSAETPEEAKPPTALSAQLPEGLRSEEPAPHTPESTAKSAVAQRPQRLSTSVIEIVAQKYRYLFDDLKLSAADRDRLKQLLLEREDLAIRLRSVRDGEDENAKKEIPALEARMAEVEQQIEAILQGPDLETYQTLKESDTEQYHLSEYTGGVSNVSPLSPAIERSVLEAKLKHKKAYEGALRDSGFNQKTLSDTERSYAHAAVVRALNEYRDGFLRDVQPMLNEEQYVLLSNYEATEFSQELQRLQMEINAK